MTDRGCIASLLKIGGDASSLQAAQQAAAKKLLHMDGEHYPTDGCAITQSCLLEAAGIVIPDTYLAIAFGAMLEKRGWLRIAVGQQKAGDIGSTCKAEPDHGNDHVYLCLRPINDDEMVIADNQAHVPHMRYASGKGGKTPTTHFLRAPPDLTAALVSRAGAAPLPPARLDGVATAASTGGGSGGARGGNGGVGPGAPASSENIVQLIEQFAAALRAALVPRA